MQPLNLEILEANAWRTLGLPATASQADVDQAVRKMRIWLDPAHIPPTPWDFPALGSISRTRNDLAQAVSRLNEPQSRIFERLLWFHTEAATQASPSGEALDSRCSTWADSPDPAARHDSALASLHAAMKVDSNVSDEGRWRRAIGGFMALAESEGYRRWLHRTENEGDFEKRAEPDEIDLAIVGLPDSIAGSLVAKATDALDVGEIDRCGRILRLLGELQSPGLQQRVLDRIEDALDRNCRRLHDEIGRRLICDHDHFAANHASNRKIAMEYAEFYKETITPLQVLVASGAESAKDPDRGIRTGDLAGKALAKVALSWVWAGKYIIADRTYDTALRLAAGASLVASIQSAREENAGRALRERQGGSRSLYSSKPRSKRSARGAVGIIVGMIFLIRMFISIIPPSSKDSPAFPQPGVDFPQINQQEIIDELNRIEKREPDPNSGASNLQRANATTKPSDPRLPLHGSRR